MAAGWAASAKSVGCCGAVNRPTEDARSRVANRESKLRSQFSLTKCRLMKNFLFPVDFFSNRVTLDQGLSGQAHRNEERLAGQGADPLVRGRPPGRPLACGRKLIPNEERVQGDPRGPGGPPHWIYIELHHFLKTTWRWAVESACLLSAGSAG